MKSHNHRWFLTNQFQILFNHWQHCCYGQATISHLGATWMSLHPSFDHFSDHLMIVSGLFIPALKLIPLFWSLLRPSSGRLRPSAGRRHCAAHCFRRWTWPRWARSRAGSGCTCSRSSNARGWNRVPPASGYVKAKKIWQAYYFFRKQTKVTQERQLFHLADKHTMHPRPSPSHGNSHSHRCATRGEVLQIFL